MSEHDGPRSVPSSKNSFYFGNRWGTSSTETLLLTQWHAREDCSFGIERISLSPLSRDHSVLCALIQSSRNEMLSLQLTQISKSLLNFRGQAQILGACHVQAAAQALHRRDRGSLLPGPAFVSSPYFAHSRLYGCRNCLRLRGLKQCSPQLAPWVRLVVGAILRQEEEKLDSTPSMPRPKCAASAEVLDLLDEPKLTLVRWPLSDQAELQTL